MTTPTTRATSSLASTTLLAVGLALAVGCLCKPDRPGAQDGGRIDAAVVGGDAGCPAGGAPLPPDLLVRRVSSVGDLGGDGRDDVVLWGRTSNGTGAGAVVILPGGSLGAAACGALTLDMPTNVEPLDARILNADLAGPLDLLVLGREQDLSPISYKILLYRDVALSTVISAAPVIATIPISSPIGTFDPAIGNTINASFPAWVTTWSRTTPRRLEVVFGGLHAPYGAVPFDTSNERFGPARVLAMHDGANPVTDLVESNVQDMTGLSGGEPRPLVAVTQGNVYRLDHDTGLDAHTIAAAARAPLTDTRPRFVRWLAEAQGNGEYLAVTGRPGSAGTSGVDLLTVTASAAPVVTRITDTNLPGEPSLSFDDLALAFVGGGPTVDVVMLGRASASELRVILDPPTDGTPHTDSTTGVVLPDRQNILAVGDFDGDTQTADTILAISTSPGADPVVCYHVLPAAPTPCLVPCDVAACP